ncbi:MAG: glutaredoxin family protein [Chloroflexi bacterium]|nr:glutaredoxin family protein [Chloroflexota bacterium]MCZ6789181.1 glutaredoxin family protein [Chloroflexota bacterium]
MVKVYLSRKGIPFTEHNVSIDLEARKRLIALGYRSTPVTVIGDHKIVGYKPPNMDEALAEIS